MAELHEFDTGQAQLAGGSTGRHLAIGKERQNRLLAEALFKLLLVDRLVPNVQFDLQLDAASIVL